MSCLSIMKLILLCYNIKGWFSVKCPVCGAPPAPTPPLLCPQPCFSATFSNGVETDFSPLLPERWAESISVDGLVSKNELLTTKRSFHTSPEYTVTPHACLLPASLPWLPDSALQAKLHIHRSKLGKAIRSLLICQIGWGVSGYIAWTYLQPHYCNGVFGNV